MGVSTDGQICFGVAFPESFEFPWDEERFGGEIDKWWREAVCGYKPPFELYDENGEYVGGQKPPQKRIDEYIDLKNEFDKKHPVPFKLINYCSHECPMYIVAVPSSCIENSRGYPEEFRPENLKVSEKEVADLKKFLEDYAPVKAEDLEYQDKRFDKTMTPRWYLSSYWG